MIMKIHACTVDAKITSWVCYEVGQKIITNISYDIVGIVHFAVTRVKCLDQMPFTMASVINTYHLRLFEGLDEDLIVHTNTYVSIKKPIVHELLV